MYPYFADMWNAYRNSLLIADYQDVVKNKANYEEYESILAKADEYNQSLKKKLTLIFIII